MDARDFRSIGGGRQAEGKRGSEVIGLHASKYDAVFLLFALWFSLGSGFAGCRFLPGAGLAWLGFAGARVGLAWLGFAGSRFRVGLLALPLCGAALTFFAAAKKVSKESSY
ncbi:hypothetical protein [Caballeronia sp. ATUFL_F1_KS4A]|uniref:hypothetical protein n=1 Tax=Caballeronia sp. ATUFL_F1_KS4A TaxID=2921768 RepID=UPI0020284AAD|nr:hypothetical protein [Caballeronia sp. ATUFL_F1_KS4A]